MLIAEPSSDGHCLFSTNVFRPSPPFFQRANKNVVVYWRFTQLEVRLADLPRRQRYWPHSFQNAVLIWKRSNWSFWIALWLQLRSYLAGFEDQGKALGWYRSVGEGLNGIFCHVGRCSIRSRCGVNVQGRYWLDSLLLVIKRSLWKANNLGKVSVGMFKDEHL